MTANSVRQKLAFIADQPQIAQQLQDMLGCSHVELQSFVLGNDLLNSVSLPDFKLIILDPFVADFDGFEFMGRLGKQSIQTPLLLVSAQSSSLMDAATTFGTAVGLNMLGILPLPFSNDELFSALKAACAETSLIRSTILSFGDTVPRSFIPAKIPEDESWRLAELRRLGVLDTNSDAEFESLAIAASTLCATPIALVSLVDADRQWFKAKVGLDVEQTSRDIAFCSHAILNDQLFEINDASKDLRFAANPLVTGEPFIAFYAGVPLILDSGARVGTLCVIDRQPRELNQQQRQVLRHLGLAASKALEAKHARIQERNLADLVKLREERYRGLVAALHLGLIVQTPTLEFNMVNARACELLGLSEDQLRGKTSFDPEWNVIRENGEYFPSPEHPLPQAIATGKSVLNVVMGVYRPALKDRAWLLVSAVPQMSQGGNVEEVACTFIDISTQVQATEALKQADREKDALLKEVHHRVKNNLQVIASLLRLESHRSVVENTKLVLGDMQARIRAMALLHESLYRSGTFASVDLGNYLRKLATQAFQTQSTNTGAVQLVLNLGSVQVGMDQAIPCGLLINELISNCLKHGFPLGVSGHVSIELQPLDAPSQWCLRVRDTGVGLQENFEERRDNSLGLQLAVDLARQIGGALEIQSTLNGGVALAVNFRVIKPEPLVMPA